jgi:hydantoinase/carbamoylase family amidase
VTDRHDPVVARLERLATFGATEHGIDRRLFSPADAQARAQFAAWARTLGCAVEQDRAGNVFARRLGWRDAAPILTGSHLDTVPTGGPYDGAYGVAGGLCALERLASHGTLTDRPIEVVAWAGEEGSRFPLGCLGSAVFAGLDALADIEALRDERGVSFADARAGASGLLPGVRVREHRAVPAAYVELHIEQGPVLERAGARLGNVTAIAGQVRYEVAVTGTSGHAGTVPMALRNDPLSATAELILALERAARGITDSVLTVGRLAVEPNQQNVIPRRVIFRIDARSVDEGRLAAIGAAVARECERVGTARGVEIVAEEIESRPPVAMDARLRSAVAFGITAAGEKPFDLPSGAGHDAMCIAAVAPVAMIFVPSTGGLSHVAGEYTKPEDCALGVRALTETVLEFDRLFAKDP